MFRVHKVIRVSGLGFRVQGSGFKSFTNLWAWGG